VRPWGTLRYPLRTVDNMSESPIATVAKLAAASHSVLTRPQAAQHLSDRRLATAIRQGWLIESYPGVLAMAGASPTFEHQLRAATLAAGGRAAASHRSAARLHRLDGFTEVELAEVSISAHYRWQFPGNVVAHHIAELNSQDITEINGIRVTSLARTLADLGSVVSTDLVAQALTAARREGCSTRWIRSVAERLDRPGQSGTSRILRLLDAIPHEGRVAESWFEELLARCLEDPRIPGLIRQHEIHDSAGTFVARVDLAVPRVTLAIEAHSKRHHFGPQAEAADADRDLRLAACGWEVLYLGWHATKTPREVADRVVAVVEARRPPPGTPAA
jgi:very-short-patch-repair endonuclease